MSSRAPRKFATGGSKSLRCVLRSERERTLDKTQEPWGNRQQDQDDHDGENDPLDEPAFGSLGHVTV
ncbi:MAG TPA: hypothetical protein VGA08_00220 [Candidatus Saccharimonadales bacterium]